VPKLTFGQASRICGQKAGLSEPGKLAEPRSGVLDGRHLTEFYEMRRLYAIVWPVILA